MSISQQQHRSFSSSQQRHGHERSLAKAHTNVPAYPYGKPHWYKQSAFGLYGGLTISSGNNVSPKTETKTRRKWRPNIQMKRLYSHALHKFVRVKVATRVLRTIDKSGGLDEYLVGSEKAARVKELGMKGWKLRCEVMSTEWWKSRSNAAREELDLPPVPGFAQPRPRKQLLPEPEEYRYVSGKLKRRAIVAEVKAKRREKMAEKRERRLVEKGETQLVGLRAGDIKQHLAFKQQREGLSVPVEVLAAEETTGAEEARTPL